METKQIIRRNCKYFSFTVQRKVLLLDKSNHSTRKIYKRLTIYLFVIVVQQAVCFFQWNFMCLTCGLQHLYVHRQKKMTTKWGYNFYSLLQEPLETELFYKHIVIYLLYHLFMLKKTKSLIFSCHDDLSCHLNVTRFHQQP